MFSQKSGNLSQKSGNFSGEIVSRGEALSDGFDSEAFLAFVQTVHPEKTAENVAADISSRRGFSATTERVQKWLRGTSRPDCDAMVALIAAYGASFIAAIVPAAVWARDVAKDQRRARLQAQLAELDDLTYPNPLRDS